MPTDSGPTATAMEMVDRAYTDQIPSPGAGTEGGTRGQSFSQFTTMLDAPSVDLTSPGHLLEAVLSHSLPPNSPFDGINAIDEITVADLEVPTEDSKGGEAGFRSADNEQGGIDLESAGVLPAGGTSTEGGLGGGDIEQSGLGLGVDMSSWLDFFASHLFEL